MKVVPGRQPMKAIRETRKYDATPEMLRQLFDAAKVKVASVECSLDAEPEMARFLHAVKAHPEHRALVAQWFIDDFINQPQPLELLMFCMHDLRWPEIQEAVKAGLDEDIRQHNGIPVCNAWNDILDVYRNRWENASYYHEFKTNKTSS